MEINENKKNLPNHDKILVVSDYLSKSSDGTINSSLEQKDYLSCKESCRTEDEELSLEKGESSSFHPSDDYGFLSMGDCENSDDATMPLPKGESTRQKFRRFRHKEYQCDECDRMFTLKHNLQNHFVQYHMGCKTLHKACPSSKCTICGKIYSGASVLAEHMLHEHDKCIDKYQCSQCHDQFLSKTALQKHRKEHNRERKSCPHDECMGLKFKYTRELNEHVRLEHKLKELSCSVCNMVFRQLPARIKHEEEHEKKLRDQLEGNRTRARERRAKCDEDLVKREPESPSPPPSKTRKIFSPQFEAVPIKKKTTNRLTKAEILAKIK